MQSQTESETESVEERYTYTENQRLPVKDKTQRLWKSKRGRRKE